MAKAGKIRLDSLLVERGLAPSRARAQAMIMAGEVFHDTERLDKPGRKVAPDIDLALRRRRQGWVSRAGAKLAFALDRFGFDPKGLSCLDIGASTGGFTEVLLARGAARVVAVDVGRGQLDGRLRHDPRILVLDRTNARYLTRDQIPEPPAFITCDVSFISLTKALPAALDLAAPRAKLIALIKPQFEAGKALVAKGGVVRDPAVHAEVCARIRAWLAARPGWSVCGIEPSPIKGAKGNIEFLIAATRR